MSAFGAGRLHACRLNGAWDLERMASGYASALFRSIRNLVSKDGKETGKTWDDLTFRFGPRAFLFADESRIIGFAATAPEAERLVTECGEKFRLQIICTINCSAADIDPALLRPGRLLSHRVFGRLDHARAERLAESLGRKLPVAGDYSLAEVFAGHDQEQRERRAIGFAP